MKKRFLMVIVVAAAFAINKPLPSKAVVPICDPGEKVCCSSTRYKICNTNGTGWSTCYSCAYGCSGGACKPKPTSVPPTSTPVPTSTPAPSYCCTGPSYCFSMGYSSCKSDTSCYWTCIVPTSTPAPPTSTPVLTPTSPPKVCSYPSYRCRNLTGVNPAALIETCSSDQTKWVFSYNCPSYQTCNSTGNGCNSTISSSTTPAPVCAEGSTKCSGGFKMVCYHGNWELAAPGGSCITPTPTITSTSYNCPLTNGVPNCTQTNPLWANSPFPGGCPDPGSNYLYKSSCNIAVTCSLLCACKNNSSFCNLQNCINSDSLFQSLACSTTTLDFSRQVLAKYPECFNSQAVKPNVFVDAAGQSLGSPLISWDKIDELLQVGKLQVLGKFTLTAPTGKYEIDHISLIVKKDSVTGKRMYNDPYFNNDNPNSLFRINSPFLEDYLDIKITGATLVY